MRRDVIGRGDYRVQFYYCDRITIFDIKDAIVAVILPQLKPNNLVQFVCFRDLKMDAEVGVSDGSDIEVEKGI
jgi:hypothetical protein